MMGMYVLNGSPLNVSSSWNTRFRVLFVHFLCKHQLSNFPIPTSNNAIPFISESDAAINVIVKSRRGIANTSPARASPRQPAPANAHSRRAVQCTPGPVPPKERIVAKLQERYDDTVSSKFYSFVGMMF